MKLAPLLVAVPIALVGLNFAVRSYEVSRGDLPGPFRGLEANPALHPQPNSDVPYAGATFHLNGDASIGAEVPPMRKADVFRIVVVGGAAGVPGAADIKPWPAILEGMLNAYAGSPAFEVFNFSFPGRDVYLSRRLWADKLQHFRANVILKSIQGSDTQLMRAGADPFVECKLPPPGSLGLAHTLIGFSATTRVAHDLYMNARYGFVGFPQSNIVTMDPGYFGLQCMLEALKAMQAETDALGQKLHVVQVPFMGQRLPVAPGVDPTPVMQRDNEYRAQEKLASALEAAAIPSANIVSDIWKRDLEGLEKDGVLTAAGHRFIAEALFDRRKALGLPERAATPTGQAVPPAPAGDNGAIGGTAP
jgi:hypothetical protein